MRRDAIFCDTVHFVSTNLHFKRHAVFADDRCMQRLIHIGFRHGDIILKAIWHLFPKRMHHAQHSIAVLYGIDQNADGNQIENLLKRFMLEHHFAVNAVKMLRPAVNLVMDIHFLELIAQHINHSADVFFPLGALHADFDDQILIPFRIKIAQT